MPVTDGVRDVGRRSDALRALEAVAAHGGDLVPFTIGRRRAILLNHPSRIEEVLVRHAQKFDKGPGYLRAGRVLGGGLLTAGGAEHAERRRLLQPAFHRQRIDGYARSVIRIAAEVRDGLGHGDTVDIAAAMRCLTLRVAGETLFSAELRPHAAAIREAVDASLAPTNGLVSIVSSFARARQSRRVLEDILEPLVDERLQTQKRSDDVLGLLLAEAGPTGGGGAGLAGDARRARLLDDAVTLLLAGHDTVAHALTWTWRLLAERQDAAERLYREARDLRSGGELHPEDLPRLQYAKSVVAESLRLFPPAWVIVRRAVECHVSGNTTIPAGTLAVASPFITHRDRRFFADPLAFRPERWSETDPGRPRLAYFPFGAGPRACIGEHFAWMEATLVLATISRRWMFERCAPLDTAADPRITLRPQTPVLMRPVARPL